MKIEDLYKKFQKYKKVTTDSRLVEKDAMFFALKGENFNGNVYASKAINNGCSCAIVDEKQYVKDERYIFVEDTLKSLQSLANYHRKKLGIPILAITGTNGKTTTKELIASVLTRKYDIHYTKGNLNNHIGVPLTLLGMDNKTELGLVEMGANHMGEINLLCEIAEPNYGIITNIGKAHLEGFGSFENIIKAKQELYRYLLVVNGKVFYNAKNDILAKAVNNMGLPAISFNKSDSRLKGEVLTGNQFLSVSLQIDDYKAKIQTQLIGNYNLENVLAAAAIGYYFGVDKDEIVKAIENYTPKNNRSQFVETKRNKIYLDAYNANPTSVELAINNFASLKKKNSCIILGDMLELGNEAVYEHQNVIKLIQSKNFDRVILVGNVFSSSTVPENYLQFVDVNALKKWLLQNKISNSNVLVKGSRGIQLETIVEYL